MCIEVVIQVMRWNESTNGGGVAYRMNSKGPRTEPLGTLVPLQKIPEQWTRKERDDTYDLNQFKTVPWMPNQEDRWENRMLWSMVSKAADRSRFKKAQTWYMLWADGIDEMIVNVEESSFDTMQTDDLVQKNQT